MTTRRGRAGRPLAVVVGVLIATGCLGDARTGSAPQGSAKRALDDPSCVTPVASALDRSVATTLATATAFLYSGASPIQTGVASGTILPATAAVVRGNVFASSGAGLPGVTVTVANHPELGSTVTQCDGAYDLAVNGGQTLRLHFSLSGYLPADRVVQAPWQDFVFANDLTLIPLSTAVTSIDLSPSGSMQVARGTTSTDSDGTRRATLLVPAGTTATMTLPDGSTPALTTMSVRATEYSVGTSGPSAMPADLPATSSYTYAVELSADEAIAAGASAVTFSQALPLYLENFLTLPVGTTVPGGYYDASKGAWVASASGVILKILAETGGEASVDVDGDGVADTGATLTALGITDAELQQLAALYSTGQALWRAPVAHFTGWGLGWPNGQPPGAPDTVNQCWAGIEQTECPGD